VPDREILHQTKLTIDQIISLPGPNSYLNSSTGGLSSSSYQVDSSIQWVNQAKDRVLEVYLEELSSVGSPVRNLSPAVSHLLSLKAH